MRCVDNIASGANRSRQNMLVSSEILPPTLDVVIAAQNRASRRHFRLESKDLRYRKDWAYRAADLVFNNLVMK